MVDYNGLENRRAERHRGFESLSLRKERVTYVALSCVLREVDENPGSSSRSAFEECQLVPLPNLLPSDEVGTAYPIFHQRHRSDEFASPVGVVIIETADVQDEVGRHVHLLAHPLNICLRMVLVRRCPPFDDGAHGISLVLHSICPQQSESSSVAPFHCLELIKTLVVLHFQQTFPLILTPTDIQRITISKSSWYHYFHFLFF